MMLQCTRTKRHPTSTCPNVLASKHPRIIEAPSTSCREYTTSRIKPYDEDLLVNQKKLLNLNFTALNCTHDHPVINIPALV